MANWNDRWVIPHDGGWAVAKEDRERVSARFDTQAAAIERGREIVRNAGGGELTVLAQDGRIRHKDTVGAGHDDPTKPG
jgi:hypothetical protein